jgi:hypothetical protein
MVTSPASFCSTGSPLCTATSNCVASPPARIAAPVPAKLAGVAQTGAATRATSSSADPASA